MFSNLSKGSVLYGLDTNGDMKYFTAPIESVTIPYPKYKNSTYGQMPEMVMDIVAIVNGERKEYKQVPSTTTVADFSPMTFILADNKDSLVNHIKQLRQTSQDVLNSVPEHEARIPKLDRILGEIDPGTANDNAVKELKGQVESMQSQMQEMLALLRQKAPNTV
jgi:hypothetical protein